MSSSSLRFGGDRAINDVVEDLYANGDLYRLQEARINDDYGSFTIINYEKEYDREF